MTGELVREAWAELDRLRTFLRSLEWAGTAVIDYDGVTAACCPSCGGIKPGEEWSTLRPSEFDHRPDCEFVAALRPATPTPEKPDE